MCMKNLFSGTVSSGFTRQYDPLNNFFFHKIFGEKGDEVQLLGFINAVLGRTGDDKFISVEILENKSFMADIMGGKSCVLDVGAQLQNGTVVNIEVQIRDKHNMDRRSLFYMSKAYTEKLKSGHDYIELPDVIAINIVGFDFPVTSNFHSCFHLREDTEREIVLTNVLEIHFINMVKYKKQGNGRLDDPLSRWLTWFNKDSPPELLQEVVKMDSAIQTAEDRLHHVTQSEEDMRMYTRYMMAECDRTSEINFARDQGREKGFTEASNTIARKLLAEGSTHEFIQKMTGLSLEEIKKLL